MNRDDLTALIARVEAATVAEQDEVMRDAVAALTSRWDASRRAWIARALDAECYESAALTLVPEEWGREFWHEPGEKAQGNVWPPRRRFPRWTCSGFAATPALALTAAALRARLAQMGDGA